MNGSIFFQHPIGLWEAEPYRSLAESMGPVGKGIYWDVFEQIRLGGGKDSLDHLMMLYDGVKNRRHRESLQKRLREILKPECNLFFVNQQRQVSIIDHAKDIRERNKQAANEPWLFDVWE